MKIAIIGGGRLGSTLARAFARAGVDVIVSDPNAANIKADGFKTLADNNAAVRGAEIAIIAVKPGMVQEAVKSISGFGGLIVSCAAGMPISKIGAAGAKRIIRVMPNICAEANEGMFAYALGKGAAKGDEDAFRKLFSTIGLCMKTEEGKLDAITGVSGSGPAFIAYFAKEMYLAGVEEGLTEEEAKKAVAQTLVGTGKLLLGGKGFDEIISTVASPGGTTEAGLKNLDAGGAGKEIRKTVSTAIKKAKEIGK